MSEEPSGTEELKTKIIEKIKEELEFNTISNLQSSLKLNLPSIPSVKDSELPLMKDVKESIPKLEEIDAETYKKLQDSGKILGDKISEQVYGIVRERSRVPEAEEEKLIPVVVEVCAVVCGVVAGDVVGTIVDKRLMYSSGIRMFCDE